MNNTVKKLISILALISMTLSIGIVTPLAADKDSASDELLLHVTFDETGTGTGSFTATAGGTITEKGSVSYSDSYSSDAGKALKISSKSANNYLELAEGILNGKEAATYSFWLKTEESSVPNWPFMTTNEDAHTVGTEKYLGLLATSDTFTMERYNNSGSRLSSITASSSNDWQYVTAVYAPEGSRIYINGRLAGSDSVAVNVAGVLTENSKTWIGHANWSTGEGFAGMIDDFRIYGKALSEDEVKEISAEAIERETQKVIKEKNCLDITTNFYDSEGNKVFQIAEGETVTVKANITNYTSSTCSVYVDIYPYDINGNPFSTWAAAPEEIDILDTLEYSNEISWQSGVAYYVISVKYIPNDADAELKDYDAGYLPVANVSFPEATPEDTIATTYAAHDPSIFKDPKTGIYYAYNSGNAYEGEYTDINGEKAVDNCPIDTFKSTDLVHWERIDNNFRYTDAMKQYFTDVFTPLGSKMNDQAWAPDMFYAEEDTEHPYWLTYSISTNGTNYDYIRSAMGLVKGESPTGPWVDCGILMSSRDGSKTNAIDSNIYEDINGDRYFIWGSFQRGIMQVPLNVDEATHAVTLPNVDYTSNTTIHNTSYKNFGTTLFSTPNGVPGPEGAYMINNEETGYRYMFTSYGDLSINYNIRIARSPLSKTWAEETAANADTKLLDQYGHQVGKSYSGQSDKSMLWGYKMLGSYQLGDGLTYYGNGHNSVLHDDDGNWYLVEHCRKQRGGYAVLQVRKMLWTDDGWPVVSPLVYAGEDEQIIPENMLYGTWDFSNVGETTFEEGAKKNVTNFNDRAKFDAPMSSSQIILEVGGKLGNNLGTWKYDNDHTVTITFSRDGDSANNEYFSKGDTMTLFALTGYDKDKKESALVLTGTNSGAERESVAVFAKKNNQVASATKITPFGETKPIVIEKSKGGNPILGFDQNGDTLYAGDPAALVDGDTVYIYTGHDNCSAGITDENAGYTMPDWLCYSSKDMENWKYEGSVMSASTISWASNSTSAWASQAIKYGDKYYLYFCTWDKTSSGKQSIGVAVSDSPTGPFVDKGTPLVKGTTTTPETSGWNDIDPTVWVETVDGVEHRYLAWGNGKLYACELNEDMISVKDLDGDGSVTMNNDIKELTINNAAASFTEAPWLYRQQDENGNYYGKYYLFYAAGWREQMAYATADSILGDWEFGGILMPPTATSNTNHPSVIDFKGKTYFIYHNGALPWGFGFRRSVCVEEFEINADGTINPIEETSIGLTGTASVIKQGDKFVYHENFINSGSDSEYPIYKLVNCGKDMANMLDAQWEILPGKADTANENYISIQAVNKPGLYMRDVKKKIQISQVDVDDTNGDVAKAMTFKTVKGLDGSDNGVSFESVSSPGYYVTSDASGLILTKGEDFAACTFEISKAEGSDIPAMLATVDKVWYEDNKTAHFRLNNAKVYETVDAYVAEYAENGELLGTGKETITVNSASQFVDVDYARVDANSTLKLFVWKDMMPVCDVSKITHMQSPYTMPSGYTSYFAFEDNLADSVTSTNTGVVVPTNIDGTTTASPAYGEGYKGKALKFTGAGSSGVNLGKVITNKEYTVSFKMKANAFTACTSALFINSGTKASESWISAPFGNASEGGTMIWSNLGVSKHICYTTPYKMNADEWYDVVITADGSNYIMYINGSMVVNGDMHDVIGENTDTYLGVNFWDTPFNGLIDDVYIYNGKRLNAEEVENLYFSTR